MTEVMTQYKSSTQKHCLCVLRKYGASQTGVYRQRRKDSPTFTCQAARISVLSVQSLCGPRLVRHLRDTTAHFTSQPPYKCIHDGMDASIWVPPPQKTAPRNRYVWKGTALHLLAIAIGKSIGHSGIQALLKSDGGQDGVGIHLLRALLTGISMTTVK
jgi:hypothetical protein